MDKCPKKVGHVIFWYFPDRSVKYTMTPHRNKGTTKAFDLKFSPEVNIGGIRRFAKFQVARSSGSDFTQITHFLDNRWSDRLEILHAVLDYQYLTLVQISSRYHFPILLKYKILGLIK